MNKTMYSLPKQRNSINGLTFDEWYQKYDSIIIDEIGLSSDNLEDKDYCFAWEQGQSPESFAQEVIGCLF